ncbi:MAG: hypothetical protein AABX88_01775 [Nanoarchaeota archaeon]
MFDKYGQKKEIVELREKFLENNVLVGSLIACAVKEDHLSLSEIEEFISQYNLLHEIVIKTSEYNKFYVDEDMMNEEKMLVSCFEEAKSGLAKLIYNIYRQNVKQN